MINILTLKALANLAIFSTSKNRITIVIKIHVIRIVLIGVRYFECTLAKLSGRSLSIAIAKGKREHARTPELANEISVITPIIAIK